MDWDTRNPTGPATYEHPGDRPARPWRDWYDAHLGWVALGSAVAFILCALLLGS